MKKRLIALTGIFFLTLLPAASSIADTSLANGDAGTKINAAAATTGPNFVFQVSQNVVTLGNSTGSTFSIAAFNSGAVGADGGQAYAGASDVGGTYTLPMDDLEADPTLTANGDSTDFVDVGDWESPSD